MFIKCKSIYNNADLYFNKEKIRLIEDLSTVTNLNLRNPSLKIYYNKDDTTSVEFKTQSVGFLMGGIYGLEKQTD